MVWKWGSWLSAYQNAAFYWLFGKLGVGVCIQLWYICTLYIIILYHSWYFYLISAWPQPLPLITLGEDGELKVVQATFGHLSREVRPLVIISIIGPYRTGKSFLLNILTGFHIQPRWCYIYNLVKNNSIMKWGKQIITVLKTRRIGKNVLSLYYNYYSVTSGIC